MIRTALYEIFNGNDLTREMTAEVMTEIMEGQATPAQIASFLTALRLKGETIDEITACALVMRQKCARIYPEGDVMDIVGTGGDESHTFNISTVAAFVVAAAGIPVAKHGNRSVSSRCGSADLLEALGAKLEISPLHSQEILKKVGFCFMFAPIYHTSMKYAAPVRKELGVRTLFNILGPLSNPAGANFQLLGVYDENLVDPMAGVLANLGVRRGMVVHGHDGLDEITLCDTTTICDISDGKKNSFFLTPEQLGLERCSPQELVGGDPSDNARITREILEGATGPRRDVVLLNAALCLYMAFDRSTLKQCVRLAGEAIDSGQALQVLKSFVDMTQRVGTEVSS
jgi:anthranilate phosphoribosyltransferase